MTRFIKTIVLIAALIAGAKFAYADPRPVMLRSWSGCFSMEQLHNQLDKFASTPGDKSPFVEGCGSFSARMPQGVPAIMSEIGEETRGNDTWKVYEIIIIAPPKAKMYTWKLMKPPGDPV